MSGCLAAQTAADCHFLMPSLIGVDKPLHVLGDISHIYAYNHSNRELFTSVGNGIDC